MPDENLVADDERELLDITVKTAQSTRIRGGRL